jgi:hypothetical protein
MVREQTTAIEVDQLWADLYDTWPMSRNYFTTATGRVVTQWPFGALPYRVLSRVLARPSERTRPQRLPR